MMSAAEREPTPRGSSVIVVGVVVILVLVAAAIGIFLVGRSVGWHVAGGGSSDHSAQVAQDAGASSCYQDGLQLIDRFDGSKTTIYDCRIGGAMKCVTEENGIANDVTEQVKVLFATALNASRPACLG